MHIHITSPEGEAKYWIEPIVSLANSKGLTKQKLKNLQILVEDHLNEITSAWKKHFSG